ncbi:SDR family NAD(P)-dependent oxidoreductase, partial [Klebsiella pneumoniae]|uniref:SDR family NAD(P)-dependent oxidoreductase n=1 Tax=Klebsiella pneumoniae TaxID=573 RepID=UPI0027305631
RRASAIDMRAEDWQAVLQTNLSGAFYSCQAAFPALAASGAGLIVNIATHPWRHHTLSQLTGHQHLNPRHRRKRRQRTAMSKPWCTVP